MSTENLPFSDTNSNPSASGLAPSIAAGFSAGKVRRPITILPAASQADPADVANRVLTELSADGVPKLRYWSSSWWHWSAGRYIELTADQVRSLVISEFAKGWSVVRSRHVSDVIEHLRAAVTLGPGFSPPAWIDIPTNGWDVADCLATRDSIVHLPSLVDSQELYDLPATPRFFSTVATEFGFNPNAAEPVEWLKFLAQLWGDDQPSIDTLQEIFGYALTAETRQQKVFVLIGPRRGGKGTIARVLRRLAGDGNVAGPTLSGLASNFGLEALLGKTLAIVSDVRLGRVDRSVVVERLLAISGEDKLTIDRKHRSALHLQLPTKFLLISNELPRLDDASATIISRMIVLKTTASFFGREDLELEDKLAAELPGILLWAIEGWRRLRERGRFIQPESGKEFINEMIALASPLSAFVEECCVTGPNYFVVVNDLYAAYGRWCDENGREHRGTVQRFGRDLRAVVTNITDKRPRDNRFETSTQGNRPRMYYGIGLRPGY